MFYVFHLSISITILLPFVTANPFIGSENIVPARKNEFPFVVSIKYLVGGREHLCTGSLITRINVLTSAHCFDQVDRARYVRVLIGTNDLDYGGRSYRLSSTDSWITYNDWAKKNGKTMTYPCNDIAIMTLFSEVDDDIPLPQISTKKENEYENKIAVTVGWGELAGGVEPNLLHKVSVHIMNRTECEDNLERLGYIRTDALLNEICTTANPGVLLGKGDSGGPLLINENEIIGVNQAICGQEDHPNAYNIHASVNFYQDFIAIVTNTVF